VTTIPVQSSFTFDQPKRRNVVIEAGAGTGKTTAIVAEVLKLLLGDEALLPEKIVLVTFTEKAAGEIADRIHRALTELTLQFASGQLPVWPAGSDKPLFVVPAAERDAWHRACVAQIGRIESLRSQTIHSFCQTILRQFPIEATLDPQFTIIEGFERSLLYGELYDAWVDEETRLHPTDETRHQWEVLLEHVGYLFLVRNIILPLIDRRDLLLSDLLGGDLPNLGSLDLVEHELLIAIGRLRGCDAKSVAGICDYLRDHPEPKRGSTIDDWLAYLKPIANVIRTSDLPKGKQAEFNEAIRVLRADQNKGNSVYDRLSSHRAALSLIAMMGRFLIFLDEEKRKRGVVDFDDLLLRTLAVLDDDAVLERVRGQFDFIFVDEFQDTDRVQARIIDRLARSHSGALVPGRTTVVGDPKQSIYGFRRADPETYDAFTRELIAAGGEQRHLLDQYRSEPALLQAVNAIFTDLFSDGARDTNVFRPEYHHLRAAKNQTKIRDASITIIDAPFADRNDRFASEAESIAAWIGERGEELRTYALLFRRTTKLDDYLDVFERRGIPYVLPPTRLFLDRPAPIDLLAMLRAIAFPFDRGAEISAARTPYAALTDLEIATESVPWTDFRAGLDALRAAASHLTVAQLIDLVIRTWGIESVYADAADGTRSLRHLEHVRSIAFGYDQRVGGSVREFVDEISRRRIDPDEMEPTLIDDDANAVRILTVHAAKGLEFDTVILPDLEFPLKSPEIFLVDEPRSLVLRGQVETLSAHYGRAGDDALKEIGAKREEAENRRLFYVAVTRAKSEVAFVTNTKPQKIGFARYLEQLFSLTSAPWPAESGRVVDALTIGGDTIPVAFERLATDGGGTRSRRRLADRQLETELASLPAVDPLLPPPAPAPATSVIPRNEVLARRAASQRRGAGILLHRVLEFWNGTSAIDPLLNAIAVEQGAETATIALVRKRLANVAKSETFLRIGRAETLGRELPLLIPTGNGAVERRIDRLLREGDRDVVVDYKSGRPSPERVGSDREQVEEYCRAITGITGRPCSGLLWYIDVDVDHAIEVS